MSKTNMRHVAGVTGGNSREHRVRTFLSRKPDAAVRLQLSADREDAKPLLLVEWPIAAVSEDLAPLVLQALQDHMLDVEEPEVSGTLAFVDDAGRVVASMVLKDRARDLADELTNDPMGLGTGTKSQLLQQMNQNERMHKLYIAGQATLQANQLQFVDRATGFNEKLLRRLSTLEERLAEKEAELDAMAQMVREYAGAAEAAVKESDGDGLQKGIAILTQLFPLIQGMKSLPRAAPPSSSTPQTDAPAD